MHSIRTDFWTNSNISVPRIWGNCLLSISTYGHLFVGYTHSLYFSISLLLYLNVSELYLSLSLSFCVTLSPSLFYFSLTLPLSPFLFLNCSLCVTLYLSLSVCASISPPLSFSFNVINSWYFPSLTPYVF